jgi:phage terminase large subunit-like protein
LSKSSLTSVAGWPPLHLTPVPVEDMRRGDGAKVIQRVEALCTVSKDGIAARAGEPLLLRAWQRQLILRLFARRPDGKRRHRVALIGMPRKNGKDLDCATPILTTDGWKTMGSVETGDSVYGSDGKPTRVIAVSEVFVGNRCYEVGFTDGAAIVAGEDHQWHVWDKDGHDPAEYVAAKQRGDKKPHGAWRTLTTSQIAAVRWRHDRANGSAEFRFRVSCDAQVDTPDQALLVDPYILGYWLGDGLSTSARIKVGAEDLAHVITQVEDAGYRVVSANRDAGKTASTVCFNTRDGRRGGRTGVTPDLRALGVLRNKHIPEKYLNASIAQRKALLAGLLDSDGTITTTQNKSPRVEFCVVSKRLARDVLVLVRSLGIRATLREADAVLDGRVVVGTRYRVCWTPTFNPFRLARKSRRFSSPTSQRHELMSITGLREVPSVPTRCIEIENSDGVYLVGDLFTPTHNSALGSAFALDGLVFDGRGAEVYSAAAEEKQARIVFDETKRTVMANAELRELCEPMRSVIEVPSTNSIYRVLTAKAITKEGLNVSRGIVDELHAHATDELWNVLNLATGARDEPMVIAITTAGVRTDRLGEDSICYRLFKYGVDVAAGRIDDPTFFFAWWGAPDDADHTDPEVWRIANPGYDDILNPEDLASAVRRTPENEFRAKRLNQWVAAAVAWFQAGQWEACSQPDIGAPADGSSVVLGFDGSYSGDSTALVVCTTGLRPHLDTVRLWENPDPNDAGWRVPRGDVKDAIRAACKRWHVEEIAADPHIWVHDLEELLGEGLPVVAYPQVGSQMLAATQRFYELVANRAITHAGDEDLARHIANAVLKTDSRGSRLVKDRARSTRRIDLAVASVMAVDRAAQAKKPSFKIY